jgi:hypothetical protein
VDVEALRGILKISGLQPDKLPILSDELESLHRLYQMSEILEQVIPSKKQLAKMCDEVSVAASKLSELLDEYAHLRMFFKECLGLNTDKTEELLIDLDSAARGLYEILSGEHEMDHPDGGHGLRTIENLSLEGVVAGRIISKSIAMARGRKESPKTLLFVRLRELFMGLGGTSDIGSGGPLYRFTKACSEAIDGEIQVPGPEPFRILMMAALKRRVGNTP